LQFSGVVLKGTWFRIIKQASLSQWVAEYNLKVSIFNYQKPRSPSKQHPNFLYFWQNDERLSKINRSTKIFIEFNINIVVVVCPVCTNISIPGTDCTVHHESMTFLLTTTQEHWLANAYYKNLPTKMYFRIWNVKHFMSDAN